MRPKCPKLRTRGARVKPRAQATLFEWVAWVFSHLLGRFHQGRDKSVRTNFYGLRQPALDNSTMFKNLELELISFHDAALRISMLKAM